MHLRAHSANAWTKIQNSSPENNLVPPNLRVPSAIRPAWRRRRTAGKPLLDLRLSRGRPRTRPLIGSYRICRELERLRGFAGIACKYTLRYIYAHPGHDDCAANSAACALHSRGSYALSSLLPPFAQSLRMFFLSLPVLVLGSSSNISTSRGTMKRLMPLLFLAQSITSSPES